MAGGQGTPRSTCSPQVERGRNGTHSTSSSVVSLQGTLSEVIRGLDLEETGYWETGVLQSRRGRATRVERAREARGAKQLLPDSGGRYLSPSKFLGIHEVEIRPLKVNILRIRRGRVSFRAGLAHHEHCMSP
jgi:hypothetical protein